MIGPGRLPDGSVPHALVVDADTPMLDDATAHHLRRVRRLRAGAELTVTDGAGRWRLVRLGDADGNLEVEGEVVSTERDRSTLTVAFALTKGSKPDLVVQKLTELGVDRIVPFLSEHSVVRWDDAKARAQHERWVAIARSALEQSRRVWVPQVDELSTFDAVVGPLGASLLDRDAPRLAESDTVVAVGPEGGWSPSEADAAPRVSIADTVLRAETAAIAVAALLGARR